jgi:hypothetical protein
VRKISKWSEKQYSLRLVSDCTNQELSKSGIPVISKPIFILPSPVTHIIEKDLSMFQILITPAAGKRLVAKAVAQCPSIQNALQNNTIVIIAGTTNGYVTEEIFKTAGQDAGFDRSRFFRGITLSPSVPVNDIGRLPDDTGFPGDVVLTKGKYEKRKTIFDVIDRLEKGDIIIKGANCVDCARKKAGVLIGHPKGGTIGAAIQAVIGRRVELIIPIGLEKQVCESIDDMAGLLNSPDACGMRIMPVSGRIITEIEAIDILFGLKAVNIAAGGIGGAEGSVWLALYGDTDREDAARAFLSDVSKEAIFSV